MGTEVFLALQSGQPVEVAGVAADGVVVEAEVQVASVASAAVASAVVDPVEAGNIRLRQRII